MASVWCHHGFQQMVADTCLHMSLFPPCSSSITISDPFTGGFLNINCDATTISPVSPDHVLKGEAMYHSSPLNTQHFADLAQHNSGGAYQSLALEWFPNFFPKQILLTKTKKQKTTSELWPKLIRKTRQLYEPTPSDGMVGGGPGCSTSWEQMTGWFFVFFIYLIWIQLIIDIDNIFMCIYNYIYIHCIDIDMCVCIYIYRNIFIYIYIYMFTKCIYMSPDPGSQPPPQWYGPPPPPPTSYILRTPL